MARVELVFCKTMGADYAVQVPVIIGGSEVMEVITAASTTDDVSQHAAANGQNIVKIYSDADICVAIGADPEASVPGAGDVVTGVFRVKADVPEERYIAEGDKVAVIVG